MTGLRAPREHPHRATQGLGSLWSEQGPLLTFLQAQRALLDAGRHQHRSRPVTCCSHPHTQHFALPPTSV